jgi:hypothetical protein
MKKIFILFLNLSFLFQSCKYHSNKNIIDGIETSKQITDLLSKIDSKYIGFKINESLKFKNRYNKKSIKSLTDSLNVQPWVKADFDNNGLTDILVIGNGYNHEVICILDLGNKYEIKRITRRSFQDFSFPVVVNNKIKYYFGDPSEREKTIASRKLNQITLIYKFGDFIEENKVILKHKIQKISYSTTGCYGECPIFSLTIDSSRNAKWHAKMFNEYKNKKIEGDFNTKISQEKFDELTSILNYINFEKLKDKYSVNWSDDQSSTLKITYDNGKVKLIEDYGLMGTFGLDRTYQLLFELKENQNWKK